MNLVAYGSKILRSLALMSLFAGAAFCQSVKSPLALATVDLQPSQPGDEIVTQGILPDGHIQFRNISLRKIVAAAHDVDAELVTGGPDWLDTDRFDIEAYADPTSSQSDRLLMLQSLLSERFKLTIRHDKKANSVYVLTVGKNGPKLQPSSNPGASDCSPTAGDPKQIHVLCHSYSMSALADLLPQMAGGYITLPVLDMTGLKGVYDFQIDWMGRRPYDAAQASAAAGAPKDPLAVSIFAAVAQIGLSLEIQDRPKDAIVIESAERMPASNVGHTSVAPQAPDLKPEQINSIDRYVTDEMGREHIPGIEVGVYNRGQILLAKGYGLANVELEVPVKPKTLFQSGSVGKQFVSAAVMMLVQEGKVGLDDSIVKYFPDAPAIWKPILIKNLLSHTSGLAEYESGERVGPKGAFYLRLDFTEDELVQKIEALPIEFAPGDRWDYRNTNYVLLGIMIHRITGKFYGDYLQERIFKPWYMTSTRIISDRDIIPNRSSGYEMRGSKLQNQEWVSPTFNSTADGTLYFNVLDLAKWDEALYGTSLLKQSSLDRIWTVFPLNDGSPNPANYGFAWEISTVNGHKLIEHGGAWQGFTCDIRRYVDDNLTVVVLSNLAGARPGVIGEKIAGLVNPALAPPPPKQHKEVAVDPKLFDGYVGKYQLAPGFILTITRAGDNIFSQATGQSIVQIFPEGDRDFFLKVVDAQITFVTDAQGRATELILHQGGDHHAKRIE
jgi:uncharacterized protein (TIGR03435 family)